MDKLSISDIIRNKPNNYWLAILVFVMSIFALYPNINKLTQHGDEKIYIWKAAYYGGRIVKFDFSPGKDRFLDPGFDPFVFWAVEQPFGSHVIYAIAMEISRSPRPELPYSFEDVEFQGPSTDIPPKTLFITRLTAIICASMGMTLITLRFGWKGTVISLCLLVLPENRISFSRAWAEGPLLLGFGLCIILYGKRWFPVAIGLATSFKLTALGLWPLLFLSGSCGKEFRYRRLTSICVPPIVVSIMCPVSWFCGGPFYLSILIVERIVTWLNQSKNVVFFPDRYAWPFELLALLLITHFAQKYFTNNKTIRRISLQSKEL